MLSNSLNNFRNPKQAGLTILEIMIGLGIISFVTAAMVSMLKNTEGTIQDQGVAETRDQIARNIESFLLKLPKIRDAATKYAVANNVSLKNCLTEPSAALRTNPNIPMKCQADNNPKTIEIGLAGANVYYDKNGALCKSSNCQYFKAEASFFAVCIAPDLVGGARQQTTACHQARSIHLRYQVRPLKLLANGQILKPRPENPATAEITHEVSGVLVNQGCPANSYPGGNTLDGRLVCQCIPGSTNSGTAGGQPICSMPISPTCGDKQVMLGLDQAGKPICRDKVMECKTIQNTTCPTGQWVTFVNRSGCHAKEFTTKEGPWAITCPPQTIECCGYF